MDAYSRSVAQIEVFGLENGKHVPCGSATGFFYSRDGNLYFITNWHVVTGVDPTTLIPVAAGPLPDVLVFHFKQTVDTSGKPIPAPAPAMANFPKQLNLYPAGKAVWYEHGTFQLFGESFAANVTLGCRALREQFVQSSRSRALGRVGVAQDGISDWTSPPSPRWWYSCSR